MVAAPPPRQGIEFPQGFWPKRVLQIAARFQYHGDGIIHIPKVIPSHSYDNDEPWRFVEGLAFQGWLGGGIPAQPRRSNPFSPVSTLWQLGAFTQWTRGYPVPSWRSTPLAVLSRRVFFSRNGKRNASRSEPATCKRPDGTNRYLRQAALPTTLNKHRWAILGKPKWPDGPYQGKGAGPSRQFSSPKNWGGGRRAGERASVRVDHIIF